MTSSPTDPSVRDLHLLTPEQQRELLARLLRAKVSGKAEASNHPRQFPMSRGQQGLWHAYRRDPKATPFNVYLPARFRTRLNVQALKAAIHEVVRRHASLRTTFSDDNGELLQTVHADLPPEFTVEELPVSLSESDVVDRVMAETTRPFNLVDGPLLRMKLFSRADDDWIVLATTHHIIVDFWSLVIILRDLRELFAQSPSRTTLGGAGERAPSGSYADFVHQQGEFLASSTGQQHREYWKRQANRGSHVLEMPLDRFRPSVFTGRAASLPLDVSPSVSQALIATARRLRATTFAVVLSALQVLLSRYSGQTNFYIGSPFSGRRSKEFEGTVGFFVNMLPLLVDIDESQSFADLVRHTTLTIVEALEHERVPVAEIVRDAQVARDPSRSPLFQVSCTFERSQLKEEAGRAGFLFQDQQLSWEFGGLRQESFYIPHQTCHYDLEFVFEQGEDRLRGQLIYCRDLFEQASIRELSRNFSQLLARLLEQADLPLEQVSWYSHKLYMSAGGAEQRVAPEREPAVDDTLPHMIVQAATSHWSGEALRGAQGVFSYGELLAAALHLADELSARGATRGSLIPLVASRGPRAFIGMLAIQLVGGGVVPIDADQPALPWSELLRQVQPKIVLVEGPIDRVRGASVADADHRQLAWLDMLDYSIPPQPQADVLGRCHAWLAGLRPNQTAYVVFTSGSTGTPKGVVVEHGAVANTLNWRQRAVPLGREDRLLMLLSHQFDAGLGVGWTTLTQGGTLVWGSGLDPELLIDQIMHEQVTILAAIPSLLRVLVDHPRFGECGRGLRYAWTGGEAMAADLPRLVRSRCEARLWNFYGPTEAAIEATAADVTDHPADRPVPIGLPIDNTDVMIVDRQHRQLPSTLPGEIAIAGAGLAIGYLNDPRRTAESFVIGVDDAGRSRRMYLTGDRGRKLADGSIEFLGRLDYQVKLHGYRIELEEIERAVQEQPEIERAVAVVLDADQPAAARLAVYVTTVGKQPRDDLPGLFGRMRLALRDQLSTYKIPNAWMHVDCLPLTTSGKVDRARLPPFVLQDQGATAYVQPRTAIEQFLADAWKEQLGRDVSIDRDFFDAGGSSLQAATVTSDLNRRLQVQLPTALLFDLADIRQLAAYVCEHHRAAMIDRFGESELNKQLELSSTAGLKRESHSLINSLKPNGRRPPLILVHPPGGIVACYRQLAAAVHEEQPVYAVRSRGLFNDQETLPGSLEEMAADYLSAVTEIVGSGPCVIGGWSLGGLVAYEMVRQRLAAGGRVDRLLLLDTTIPMGSTKLVPEQEQINVGLEYGIELTLDELGDLSAAEQLPMLYEHARQLGVLVDEADPEVVEQTLRELRRLFHHHVTLSRRYQLQPLDIDVHLLRPSEVPFALPVSQDRGWRYLVRSVRVDFVPGHHHSMVQLPYVEKLAASICCVES